MSRSKSRKKEWICNTCQRSFSHKWNLKRHILRIHNALKDKICWTCEKCYRRFCSKENLQVHRNRNRCSLRSKSKILLECAECGKKVTTKTGMKRHLRRLHQDVELKYECAHCSCKFANKRKLVQHLRLQHYPKKMVNRNAMKCITCGDIFDCRDSLHSHYAMIHGVTFDFETFEFSNEEEFKKWKLDFQRNTATQFIKQASNSTSVCCSQQYWCHRSGLFIPKCEDRKRLLKNIGSKKLGGVCPAIIMVKIYPDNKVSVRIQKTHVGHMTESREELKHIYLDAEEKKNIVARLEAGMPATQIRMQQAMLNKTRENFDRQSIITVSDINNIAASYGVNRNPKTYTDDALNVDAFVNENQDAVLFYKAHGEKDTLFGQLKLEDFVMVFMNKFQENALRRFGEKVVTLDGTYGTNLCEFMLHSLLVLDVDREGIPVAFLLTNKNDPCVIDIFFKCLRNRVGEIKPLTFMSDMDPSYYNSWKTWMGPTQFHLFCTWHVTEAWKEQLSKISNKVKREAVRKTTHKLMHEVDQGEFEKNFQEFVLNQDDPDTKEFVKYFATNYTENRDSWAFCYRQFGMVHTNMHLKSFHRTLERIIAPGKKIESLHDGLNFINKYLIFKENDFLTKEVRGKNVRKRQTLRKYHKYAEEYLNKNHEISIICLDCDDDFSPMSWLVGSFQENSNRLYTVKKVKVKECSQYNNRCNLQCFACDLCYHQYCCECAESTIRQNMCKHIHALGIFLKTKKLFECSNLSEESDDNQKPGLEQIPEYTNLSRESYCDEIILENMSECTNSFEDAGYIETVVDDKSIIDEEVFVENSFIANDSLETLKAQAIKEFSEVLELINSTETLQNIRENYIHCLQAWLLDNKLFTEP